MLIKKAKKERTKKRDNKQGKQTEKVNPIKEKKYENGTMVYKKVGIYTINLKKLGCEASRLHNI